MVNTSLPDVLAQLMCDQQMGVGRKLSMGAYVPACPPTRGASYLYPYMDACVADRGR